MTVGHVRDVLPRVTLGLPGQSDLLNIEFIVDTGFDGELALPAAVIGQLDTLYSDTRRVRLADGSESERSYYEIMLDWDGEPRRTEVLMIGGNPLLGGALLLDYLLQIEMIDGGEVLIERL